VIKLTKLSLIAGQSPGHGGVEITDPEVVLLVGPNNSGKSLALREIENWCIGQNETRKVIDQLDVSLPATADAAIELFQPFKTEPPANQTTAVDHMWLGIPTFRQNQPVIHEQVSLQTFRSWFGQPQGRHHARVQLARLYTVRLDGRTRFALSDPKPAGDL
jgi:ABC-type branched-subunit amino acid transport system ATPase component